MQVKGQDHKGSDLILLLSFDHPLMYPYTKIDVFRNSSMENMARTNLSDQLMGYSHRLCYFL